MHKTVLLVIDFINDIVSPDGKNVALATYLKEHKVMENVTRVIESARHHHVPIIFVKVGFSANYAECPPNSPVFSKIKELGMLKLNTPGTEFDKALNVQPTDLVIVKPRISAFYSTPLEAFLRAHQVQHIVIAGVSTDMAVQSTAREAHDRDYNVTVVGNACGAASREVHEFALKLLPRVANVVEVRDLKF